MDSHFYNSLCLSVGKKITNNIMSVSDLRIMYLSKAFCKHASINYGLKDKKKTRQGQWDTEKVRWCMTCRIYPENFSTGEPPNLSGGRRKRSRRLIRRKKTAWRQQRWIGGDIKKVIACIKRLTVSVGLSKI